MLKFIYNVDKPRHADYKDPADQDAVRAYHKICRIIDYGKSHPDREDDMIEEQISLRKFCQRSGYKFLLGPNPTVWRVCDGKTILKVKFNPELEGDYYEWDEK